MLIAVSLLAMERLFSETQTDDVGMVCYFVVVVYRSPQQRLLRRVIDGMQTGYQCDGYRHDRIDEMVPNQFSGSALCFPKRIKQMSDIKEHMEVIGADGVHVGTVDKVEGDRIKLTKADSGEGSHKGHHHFVDKGLVAGVEGNKVRLSANAAVAVTMEEEQSSKPV